MKKLLTVFLIVIVITAASGCSSNKCDCCKDTVVKYETIDLTLDNYYRYICVSKIINANGASYIEFTGVVDFFYDNVIIKGEPASAIFLTIDGKGFLSSRGVALVIEFEITEIYGKVRVPYVNS